jgi:hypothetical protein
MFRAVEPSPAWVVCSCQLSPRWHEASGSENTGEDALQRSLTGLADKQEDRVPSPSPPAEDLVGPSGPPSHPFNKCVGGSKKNGREIKWF